MKSHVLPLLVCAVVPFFASHVLQAQAKPAAVKTGNLEVGAGLVLTHPDYSPQNEAGFGLFANFDFHSHFGVEAQFHQAGSSSATSVSERTYEAGGRFLWTFNPYVPGLGRHPITPFAKFDVGAGTFNFQGRGQDGTDLLYAGGGGLEYGFPRKLSARVEYEYQRWPNFKPSGLQPNLLTIGVAYRLR